MFSFAVLVGVGLSWAAGTASADCGPGDLGPAEPYAAYAVQTLSGSFTVGGLSYAGESAVLSNFSLGAWEAGQVALTGPIHLQLSQGAAFGDVAYAATVNLSNVSFPNGGQAVAFTPGSGSTYEGEPGSFSTLLSIRDSLLALSENGETSFPYAGGVRHVGGDASLNVFEVDGADLAGLSSWTVSAPAGSTAIVRVRNFQGGSLSNFGFSTEGISAQNVVLFFPDSTGFTVSNASLAPSVLALHADLSTSNAYFGGKVVARRILGGATFGGGDFYGDLGGCTAPPPPPVPVACDYRWNVVNNWSSGAQVEVSVNWHAAPLTGWSGSWSFQNGESLQNGWNAQFSTSSGGSGTSTVSFSDAGWNGNIATDGSFSFGMVLTTPNGLDDIVPLSFVVNGANCMPLP